jgi:GNAT superfamily N-acetyltransferase
MTSLTIRTNLSQYPRDPLIKLYLSAFQHTPMAKILGPQRAYQLLDSTLCQDYAMGAFFGDQLIGLAGFQTPEGSFTGAATPQMLKQQLGTITYCRLAWLSRTEHRAFNQGELLHNGLVVAKEWRNQGVGRRLLTEFTQLCKAHQCHCLRLEVERNNLSACALYHSIGYIEEACHPKRDQQVITMRRYLPN